MLFVSRERFMEKMKIKDLLIKTREKTNEKQMYNLHTLS